MRRRAHVTGIAAALLLGGSPVLASSSVTVQGTAGATGLELDGRGSASTHIVKIAEISLTTSAAGGFTVTVTAGSLIKVDGSTPVSLRVVLVDRDAPSPSAAAFTIPSGTPYVFSTTAAGTVEKDAYIKYTPAALQDPGAYAAVVEIDIVDN
jgi:hypothetical protein